MRIRLDISNQFDNQLNMKPTEIGIFDTKTRLSEIVQQVEQGQVFYVTKRGRRVAEIRPVPPAKTPLTKGCAASDAYWMADDFSEIPDDFKDYV